jgi:ubiquinone/menaquinone biosynthesis C-methylase UbiE
MNNLPQNVFDNPAFFSGYKLLRETDSGLNGVLEIPALWALLPDLNGLQILDLGCGFGDFARLARSRGAASVTGIDVSARMIDVARTQTQDEQIHFQQNSIEEYEPAVDAFDLVISSLTLHYVQDYIGAMKKIYRALKPGGRLLFSVEHPVCTAFPSGWIENVQDGERYWRLNHYSDESQRNTRWFVDDVIKYHRTVATYVNTLIQVGFNIAHVGEPVPTPQAIETRPTLRDQLRRPAFLLLAAGKNKVD